MIAAFESSMGVFVFPLHQSSSSSRSMNPVFGGRALPNITQSHYSDTGIILFIFFVKLKKAFSNKPTEFISSTKEAKID